MQEQEREDNNPKNDFSDTTGPTSHIPEPLREEYIAFIDAYKKQSKFLIEIASAIVTTSLTGNKVAQEMLSDFLDKGFGLPTSKTDNSKWVINVLEIGAKDGNPAAQCLLAGMYLFGEGVPQNYDKAIELFRKSANQNDEKAIQMLKLINKLKEDGLI